MGATVYCESFLPRHYSMRDLSENSNSWNWSVKHGDKNLLRGQHHHQIDSSSVKLVTDSCPRYEKEFVKRTMLEHEAIFKHQVSELHRLYKVQRILMEEYRKNELNGKLNRSESTFEHNGASFKDHGILERRKMIDLRLPAEEYMDKDEIFIDPFDERSKLRKEIDEKRILERRKDSYRENSSNGIADLNEPIHCQESEPVDSSKDTYYIQSRCFEKKDISRNQRRIQEKGEFSHTLLPFRSAETFTNDAYQLPVYHSSDHGVAKSIELQPWIHRLSDQKCLPIQANPFLNCTKQGRVKTGFEISCRDFNGFYQGSSSGSNGAISNSHFSAAVKHRGLESLQKQKIHDECSTGLSWLNPKSRYRSEITNGCLDLNASIPQLTDETDTVDDFTTVSPLKSSRSASCCDNATELPVFENRSIVKEEPSCFTYTSVCRSMDENKTVKRDSDKEERKTATRFRHQIDLNLCANEDEDSIIPSSALTVKRNVTPWIDLEAPAAFDIEEIPEKSSETTKGRNFIDELIKEAAETIVSISMNDRQCHLDESVSSSTERPLKDPLTWFAETITSCNDSGKKIEAFSECRHSAGGREECSSEEFDYFEAMTLNLVEITKEDYMPKPLIPENLKFDGASVTTAIPNRLRRGQPRRGRPKRDFQRDILPGLTSLTRHEVTDDLQMFKGLMKATGCSWNSGVTRKKSAKGGSNRGRKRLVTNITQPMKDDDQVTGPEDRNLSGWGRAIRRPRRQRDKNPSHNKLKPIPQRSTDLILKS